MLISAICNTNYSQIILSVTIDIEEEQTEQYLKKLKTSSVDDHQYFQHLLLCSTLSNKQINFDITSIKLIHERYRDAVEKRLQ